MKKWLFLFFTLLVSAHSFAAVTALTLNPTATGWATTSGRTTGDISVTNAANRGYAVFDLSTLSIPAGCVVSTVTLSFTITSVGGASAPTCTIYGYTGDISTLSATSIYAACTSGTTSLYTATWGTVAASPKTMATTAAAVSYISSNLSGKISVCWVLSASSRTYAINGTTTPVPVLTVSYCNAPTAVSITASPNPVCSGSTLTLTGNVTDGATYSWAGPNSFSSTLRNPTAFTTSTLSAGVYSFTPTSACGSTAATVVRAVTVNTASPTAITGGAATLCGATGYTMSLSDSAAGGVWTSSAPANATINPVTGVLTSVSTGATTVSYNTGCGSPATLVVTVRAIPTVVVNNPTGSACYGASASITASGGTTYTWSPAAGLSGTATATVTATPTTTTTYTVTGTTSGCSNTATSTITGSTSEAIFSITATASPATTCSGGTATLYEAITNTNYNTVSGITYAAVATTGTTVLAGEDDNYVTVTIPFTFNFYGVNYTSVNICTNGFINFGTPSVDYTAYTLPDYSAPEGQVALFAHDLDVSAGGNIKYTTTGTTPNRKFIVSYNGVSDYGGGATNTGQIILYETTNNIDLLIASVTEAGANYVTTGVQDLTGSRGIAAPGRNGVDFDASSEAWRFTGLAPTTDYTYSWTPSGTLTTSTSASPVASPISTATTFTVTATDPSSGCYKKATTTVNIGTLIGTISANTQVCTGSSASVIFSGPGNGTATYTVNGGSPVTVSLNIAGLDTITTGAITSTQVYSLVSVASGSCSQSITGQNDTITAITPPTVSLSPATATYCYTSAVTLTASGTATGYTWAPATGLSTTTGASVAASPAIATNYTVTASIGACQVRRTINVGLGAPFTLAAVATPTITCTGGASTLSNNITNTNFNTVTSITYSAVSTAGTTVLSADDDNNIVVSLPFTFFYYGVGYNTVSICTNGFINFGTPTIDLSSYTLPDASAPGGMVALFLHDLDPSSGGTIKYQTLGTSPNRKFVVSYNNVPDFGGGATNRGQIILYETSNVIDLLLASVTQAGVNTVTTGIQDLSGTNGVGVPGRNGIDYDATNEAWRFTGVPTSGYTYAWSPSGSLTSSTASNPVASPITSSTVFTLTATDATSGCSNTSTTTVNVGTIPGAISGTATICAYNTTNITFTGPGNAVATYTINGGAPLNITLDSSGTAILPTGSLSATTVYELTTITSGVCVRTFTGQIATVTVNPAAGAISGSATVCTTSATTLTNPTSGGTWSSSLATRATVNSSTGVVTGVATGAVTISYVVGSCPATTFAMNVIGTPAAITPATAVSICALSTTTLADATAGGVWSSSNTARATVDTATGVVTGVSAGTVTITYSNGCGTAPTKTITVNTMPAAITGTSLAVAPVAICTLTAYNSFTNSVSGGTWSNSPVTVGTISSSTGIFNSGTAIGTTTITYTIGSCFVTAPLNVGSTPPASITGTATVCATATTTLANATAGGVWSSSNLSLATVGATTGIVTGVNAGTVTITYNNGCGTPATRSVTVNGSTVVLSADTVCSGATLHLTATLAATGTYSWAGPGGYTSTLQNPSITNVSASAAGTYTFSTTSTAGSCTSSGQVFGIVDQIPSVTVTATPSSFCVSGTSSLSDVVISPTSMLVYAIPYNPVTVTSGTNGPSGDDAQSNVTLPFSFNYYGTTYTTVHICTNGFINFGAANTDYSSLAIPDVTAPPGMVSLFWQDLYANPGEIKYTTVGSAPNRKFVISFNSVYDLGSTSPNTGQIVLYETKNMIDMYVAHANEAVAYTPVCGIQNSTGTAALTAPGENADYYSVTGPGEAWRFVTPSYTYSWLPSAGLSSATVYNPTTGTLTSTTIYTVTTTDIYSSCTGNVTTKTVTINPLPASYSVTGGGVYCSIPGTGAHIGLSGSDTGVNYQLKRGSTLVGSPVAGTGSALDFGLFTDTTGIYTVVATNPITTCTTTMSGSTTLSLRTSPTAYSITGGSGCSAAVTIGLANSQTGVSYQLYNGASTSGSPLSGTGSPLSYGVASASGTYTILGTGSGGCTTNMTDSSVITLTPTTYTVTGGTACSATGVSIGLSNSQSGMSYQLYRGASTVGGTVTGTGAALSVGTYTVAGTYKIVADGGAGCTANMNDSAVVNASTSITLGSSPSVCQPISSTSVSYTGATGSPTTYSITWDATALSAGFSHVTGASLTGSVIPMTIPTGATGSFSATVTVSNGFCTSPPYSITITVYAYPTAAITSATGPCTGYSTNIIFTGTSGAIIDYNIDGGSTSSATLTGGTYSLSTGAISSSHSYRLINAHNPVCSNTAVDTTVTVNPLQMTWIGGTTGHLRDWHTSTNWSCGFVPTNADDVFIPVTANSPVVSASADARNLVIDSAAVVSIDTLYALNVKGNFTNNGSVVRGGLLVLNGTSTQNIAGKGMVSYMELNNSNGAAITSASRVFISRELTLTSGNLSTGDSLVLGADTSSIATIFIPTAIVNPIASGASISGKVRIQQYIAMGRRAYRFWGHPFSTYTDLTQVQNYIDVTGQGGAANGFVPTATNAPSAIRYNPLMGNSALPSDPGWRPYTSCYGTQDSNRIHQYQGFRLFFRGGKGEGLGYLPYTPSPVIIEQWGPLNQGNQTIHLAKGTAANQEYNMVGNPYPSPVDIGTVIFNAKRAGNIAGAGFYIWNPYLGTAGQFQVVTIPTTTAIPFYVQANTAFQVRAAHNNDTLNFTEGNKSHNVSFALLKQQQDYVSLTVYDDSYHPYDMFYLQFNNNASNNEDADYDATKPPSAADLNFYSLSDNRQKLAIDARPFKAGEIIPLGITSANTQELIIKAENMPELENHRVYLHDKLLKQYVLLQAGTEYHFSITIDKATQGENRFELSMEPAEVVTQTKGLEVNISPNPATDNVNVSFTSAKKEDVSIRVMDLTGTSIYNKDLGLQQKGTTTISLANFASGIYMVELSSGKEKVVQRLVKE